MKDIYKALITFLRGDATLVNETNYSASNQSIQRADPETDYKMPCLVVKLVDTIPLVPDVDGVYTTIFHLTAFDADELDVMDILAATRAKLEQAAGSVAEADWGDTTIRARGCRVTSETGTMHPEDGDYWQGTLIAEVDWDRK